MEGFRALTNAEKEQLELVMGHMGFGLHTELPRPATYVTLLRDPVERVISQYQHERREKAGHLYDYMHKNNVQLDEYARYYAEAGEMDNLQTRMVAGNWDQRGFGACDDAMLAKAKHNLDAYFTLVGVTERFDEFYILLAKLFGWELYPYRRLQTAKKSLKADAFSASEVAVVREYNRYDIALYEYASQKFDSAISQTAGLGVDLAKFRAKQAVQHLKEVSVRETVRKRIRGRR